MSTCRRLANGSSVASACRDSDAALCFQFVVATSSLEIAKSSPSRPPADFAEAGLRESVLREEKSDLPARVSREERLPVDAFACCFDSASQRADGEEEEEEDGG